MKTYKQTDMILLKLKSGKTISVSSMDAIKGTIWEELLEPGEIERNTKASKRA